MVPQSRYPVLLLTGNEELVQLLEHALQPEGMSVTVAASLAVAKDAFAVTAYAVVVVEPSPGGLALLTFLRGDARYARIPIVVVVPAGPADLPLPPASGDVSVVQTPIEAPVLGRLLRLLAIASTEPRP